LRVSARLNSLAFAAVAASLVLTACHGSVSIGSNAISQKNLEKQVAAKLAAQTKLPVPTVVCPGNLKGVVGTVMICQLTPQHSTEKDPVTLKVTSVSKGVANYDISVGQPEISPSP
jgi:Domain of unknown function (DUF4333)